jgi:hypothetical protein
VTQVLWAIFDLRYPFLPIGGRGRVSFWVETFFFHQFRGFPPLFIKPLVWHDLREEYGGSNLGEKEFYFNFYYSI